MEMLEVLSETGEPTGKIKSRRDIHRDGDWHCTVHAWIINSKQELLLQRRSLQKESDPNTWGVSSIAGHVIAGQTVAEAVLTEAQEELGITLKPEDLEYVFDSRADRVLNNGTYIARHIHKVFLIKKDYSLADLVLQKEEVSEVKWMPFKDLEQKFIQNAPEFVWLRSEYEPLFKLLHERYPN